MQLSEALHRIQANAREITALLKKPAHTPDAQAQIHDRAELIERDSAQLAGRFMETRGTA